jgi:hypothetical protein
MHVKLSSHMRPDRLPVAYALRQRILSFVQNYQYYMMYEVLEPNWHVLEDSLRKAASVDDVLVIHSDFLDTCLKECMLTHPALLKVCSSCPLGHHRNPHPLFACVCVLAGRLADHQQGTELGCSLCR